MSASGATYNALKTGGKKLFVATPIVGKRMHESSLRSLDKAITNDPQYGISKDI